MKNLYRPQDNDNSDDHNDHDDLRNKIIGLGERSFRKSYYPELQKKLADLERFKALLDQSNDAIFLLNIPSGSFTEVNEAACTQLGYTEEEYLKSTIFDIVKDVPKQINELLSGKIDTVLLSMPLRRKDGMYIPYEINMRIVKFGKDAYAVAVARDITERMKSEKEIRESEAKFRVLSDTSPAAIFLIQDSRIVYANHVAEILTGRPIEELQRIAFWECIHPEYRSMVKKRALARQRGEIVPKRYEVMYIDKNGKEGWIDLTAGLIDYMGKPAILVTAFESTERKEAQIAFENEKAQAELYVDIMSHDITNINQSALGYLELAKDMLDMGETICQKDEMLISKPIDNLKAGSSLIDNVKKLQKEKRGAYHKKQMRVDLVIKDVKKQFLYVPGREIKIIYENLCSCAIIANDLLRDIFVNLIGNSIKHSTGSLNLYIKTECFYENNRKYCKILVEDNGPGITDARKQMIFERISGIDRKYLGKGIGLILVKTLIDDYGGKIWVEDRVKGDHTKGCRFIIVLPAIE